MIRSLVKKALGIENRKDETPPGGGMARPATGGPDGLVQLGRKPAARAREGLPPRPQDADVAEWLAQVVAENKVVVFMKGTPSAPMCGFSARVVDIFKQTGAPFQTFNVLEDGAVREGIKAVNSWPTIPQIFINGEFVGGCDIITEMASSGELSQVLSSEQA